jgi:hypothetical protein
MKMVIIAALAAAQLATGTARAAPPTSEETATRQGVAEGQGEAPTDSGVELKTGDEPAPTAARQDRPRKHKSTGDKILTGAAVVLGLGALAVGGLLVAVFAS